MLSCCKRIEANRVERVRVGVVKNEMDERTNANDR